MQRAIEIIVKNTAQRVDITVLDAAGDPVAASDGPHLIVADLNDAPLHVDELGGYTLTGTVSVAAGGVTVTGVGTVFADELNEGETVTIAGEDRVVLSVSSNTTFLLTAAHTAGASGVTATKASRLVNPTTGVYYMLWGDRTAGVNVPDQTETHCPRDVVFKWRYTGTAGTEEVNEIQVVKVVTSRTMRLLPYMRTMIDKAAMMVGGGCPLGYTDAQLIQYLEQGLQEINAYEPYPTFCGLDDYPFELFGHLLLEAGLIAGVMSQQLFAVSTDMPFSDQGNTFTIAHAPQLAAFLNQVAGRLDKLVPMMKLKLVNSGSLHVQAGNNYRMNQLLEAAPTGTLFRNIHFRG